MRKLSFILMLVMLLILAVGCSANSNSSTSESESSAGESTEEPIVEEAQELTPITQVTTWFAQPSFGGVYAAKYQGMYEEAGLDVTIQNGGPGVSGVQIVAAGEAEIGMAHATDILVARNEGIPIVALAAVFQDYPQAVLFHEGQGITSFSDLDGRTVTTAPGAPWWDYIKAAYELDEVDEMVYSGQLANFIAEETSLIQGFVGSETYSLAQEGIEVDYLMVSESGFNPYGVVMFTTEKFLEENPELVRAHVKATMEGYTYYKDHAEEINPFILEDNPDKTMEELNFAAESEVDLIFTGDALDHGVGYMTAERWETLRDQMYELGVIDEKEEVSSIFTTSYLK
ncbi:ABC transporter substrate-binding protein [Alkalihalobacillus sp. MEB130]|uniref:ABC transporter substrate-binding protein n=1 Tax=Alkalihalobacillus sp. MEB130 TaxID=2976704 RepID=UPI0028DFE2DD|nr:ABC transporter substrate-binding protein [Alkalihalobacillus sp. MEB130]MDT8860808.1 ABC transporter substrate-binding protein [Alkalihalobacillus sp. MEB130]